MAARATIAPPPPGLQSRGSISRRQVEALLARVAAIIGVVLGIQVIPYLLVAIGEPQPLWFYVFIPVFYLVLTASLVAALLNRFVIPVQGAGAVLFAIGVVFWSISEAIGDSIGPTEPYVYYYLTTVAAAMAAVAFPVVIATTYLFVVNGLMLVVRIQGGEVSVIEGLIDFVYVIILGGAVVIIVAMLRAASDAVDRAQSAALDTYALAIRQHATEVERVQVDSIVHDSVLTTLLSAARARTPEERALASAMASRAIGHLREAVLVGPYLGATVSVSAVCTRIADAAEGMGAEFEVRTKGIGSRTIPASAAEAVYSAAVQAMLNSVQHAGTSPRLRRWVGISGLQPTGIEVEVGDTGLGFSVLEVPVERLGVRVSIIERVAKAGGSVEVESAPGTGTVIDIRWPRRRDDLTDRVVR